MNSAPRIELVAAELGIAQHMCGDELDFLFGTALMKLVEIAHVASTCPHYEETNFWTHGTESI